MLVDEETVKAPMTKTDKADGTTTIERPLTVAELGVDEKRMVRKIDFALIPLVMGLYMFSFLDR